MLEIGTYGTVRGEGGNILTYSDILTTSLARQKSLRNLTEFVECTSPRYAERLAP
jgi:hypothetical protein